MKKYILILILPLLWMGATYVSRGVDQSWKFDRPDVLEDLEALSGKWEIVTPNKLNIPVLGQTIKYADYPKVLLRGNDYYDFEIKTRIYLSSENSDIQAGGLILRYRNLYSYYMLFLNTKDQRLTLTRAALAGFKPLKRENRSIQPDRWYELKAICYLDHIRAFLDGEPVLDVKDQTSTGGQVGLVTGGPSLVYFDNLQVKSERIEARRERPQTRPQPEPQSQAQPQPQSQPQSQ
jgi:hypothetical protein